MWGEAGCGRRPAPETRASGRAPGAAPGVRHQAAPRRAARRVVSRPARTAILTRLSALDGRGPGS